MAPMITRTRGKNKQHVTESQSMTLEKDSQEEECYDSLTLASSNRGSKRKKLGVQANGRSSSKNTPTTSTTTTGTAGGATHQLAQLVHVTCDDPTPDTDKIIIEDGEERNTNTSDREHQKISKTSISTSAPADTQSISSANNHDILAAKVDKQRSSVSSVDEVHVHSKREMAKNVFALYKSISHNTQIPKGKPVSGRTWKTEQTTRFSDVKKDKPLRTSWEKKMKEKAERKSIKTYERQLQEGREQRIQKKKEWKANKLKRKLENEKKSEVVQVVNNKAKLKRMKKKQLRKLEKRK